MKTETSMEKIVSLCKRRGFVYPGSEIYGGLASAYDYGPLGAELKKNIKDAWWNYFIRRRDDMAGLDGGIIMSPKIWEASGHVKNFKDPLKECKKCHRRYRPDKMEDSAKCPVCGGEMSEERLFSGMFKTVIGPVEEDGLVAYLRPETAQAIFVNYKNVLDSTTMKIPFGIGQIGKAFRNEITTGQFIFRTIEFEQMEIEYFISPQADWRKIFDQWVDEMHGFMELIGLDRKKMHDEEISEEERAFYSKRTIDMEYEFPFGQDELWAIAYRTDYDLASHQKASGEDLAYLDKKENKKYLPHVIEPTFGVDRTFLAVMAEAYQEEEMPDKSIRIFLRLAPVLAPYTAAVFPLLKNKPELVQEARAVYEEIKRYFRVDFDDHGNIGKRYRRQDEIGTPYCLTVDFDTLKDKTITVRDRDTMKQERVPRDKLAEYIKENLPH